MDNAQRKRARATGIAVATWEGVDDVSTRLRRAREQAGLRIGDISARTKVKPAFLQAIETGHFETLPGHFFTRGFIKMYAREVGLRPDELAHDFDLIHSPAPVEVDKIVAVLEAPEGRHLKSRADLSPRPSRNWQFAAVGAIVLVAFFLMNRSAPTDAPAAAVAGTTGVAEAAPVATRGEDAAPERLTVQIRPRGVIWVSATSDGATAIYKLLQPGQNVTVEGRQLAFRIGNAAAFEYSINGAPGKILGAADEVREFQITPDNYRTFLR